MTVTDDMATAGTAAPLEVGRARLRKEDRRLVTGRNRYTDSMVLPGMHHLAMVRSPFARARITAIDTAAAVAADGVVAVLTGADVADVQGSLPNAWPISTEQKTPGHPSIAVDRVNFAGEIVAVVIARTPAKARDAAELVDVDYDDLPPILDLARAATDEQLVHPDLGTNISAHFVLDSAQAGTGDDVDAAITAARVDGVVVERTLHQNRLIPAFMEPRSFVCDPTGEQLVLWSSTQIPHILRLMLALTLGIAESKLRVIAPDVGGGFGGKLQVNPEEVITIMAAQRIGKPVKYTETRSESMVASHHGRAQQQKVTIAATRDGRMTGLKAELLADMGAYVALLGGGTPALGAFMFNGIYKIPSYRFDLTTVLTNKTWTDAYRGAGRPEATFAIERMVDELAVELDMEPMELRRKNWITAEEFPFSTVSGLEYDTGNYEAATDKALAMFGYDELRAEQRLRRESGDPVQLGIGISTFTEMCGLAPSRVLGSLAYGAGGWESASIRMLPTGKVEVVTGVSSHGQGHETAWSQIVADRLGIPFEDIEVLHGDTQVSVRGLDTYGSRSLVVGGAAVVKAADKVIEKARIVAAHQLEADSADIEFDRGQFTVRGTDSSVGLTDIALASFTAHNLPDDTEPGIDADATFDPMNFSYPHGTHLAAMEVDTETGQVRVRSYVCVDDIGTIVNPMIVEGQVHGGLVQGISQALFEDAVYDEQGTLVSGSFVDYLVPSAPDLPSFVTANTETPSISNQLGAKGVGEAGTIASTPAIVNGVLDALRHLGVRDIDMPLSPHRVWQALHGRPTTEAAVPDAIGPEVLASSQNSSGNPTGQSSNGAEGSAR
jgi:carbon-monoxide dehydrogenase large subunit